MPELTPEQRAQLDRGIKLMVNNGASEQDVMSYAKDFNAKFNVEKKSKVGGSVLSSEAPSLSQDDVFNIKSFVTGKPVEQIKVEKQAASKPTAKITTSITQTKTQQPSEKSIDEEAHSKINSISDEDMLDPLKGINKQSQANPTNPKDILATERAKRILENRIAPDGFDAKNLLESSFFGGGDENNATSNLLREKAGKYEKNTQPLREIKVEGDLTQANDLFLDYNYKDKLYSAAVQWYAENNPTFKKELGVTGVDARDWANIRNQIPNGKMGDIMQQFTNDKDVLTYLQKENPSLIPAFQHVDKNLLKDNNDFAINQVANKVSKEVQKSGFNNIDPIFNFYGEGHKEYADQVAKSVLSPEELEVWNKNIKDNQEQYMDAPSLMQGVAEGGEGVFKGIGNTFAEPFRSASESTKRRWEKESANVSADPEGIFKVARDTGHVIGLVGAIAGTGNVLGAGSAGLYSTRIVPALSGGILPFLGDSLEEGRAKYPDSPVKAWTSALFNTSMYAALSQNLFQSKKIMAAINSVKPETNKIVERLASGAITKEAARQEANTAFKRVLDLTGGAAGTAGKITAELTAIKKFNTGLDKIMMDEQEFKTFHPEADETKETLGLFLSNIALGGFTKFGQMKNRNRVAEESYYEMASNPKKYEREINNSSIDKSFGTIQEFKENLKHIAQVKKELDILKIHPKDQKRFIFESLKEKTAKEEAERSSDSTVKEKSKEVIKEAKDIKEKILAGEDAETIVTESEQKKIDEERETAIKLERLAKDNELDNKKFDAQRSGLDGRNPDDKLKIEEIEEKRKRVNEDYIKESGKLTPKKEQEVLSPEDSSLLSELQGNSSDIVKTEGLTYFIDKATEDPAAFMDIHGKKLTKQLLNKVPIEKLTKHRDYLVKNFGQSESTEFLSQIIAQREKEQPVTQEAQVSEGGGDVDLSKTKVVDENGKPLTVYHSSIEKFDDFKDGITYFAEDKEYSRYAAKLMNKKGRSYKDIKDEEVTTYPVKLNVERVYELPEGVEMNGNKIKSLIENDPDFTKKYDAVKGVDLYSDNKIVYAVFDKSKISKASEGAAEAPANVVPSLKDEGEQVGTKSGLSDGDYKMSRLDTKGEENVFIVEDKDGNEVGRATLSKDGNYLENIRIDEKHRRKGLASKMYDFIELNAGVELQPSPVKQSTEAKSLWEKRNLQKSVSKKANGGLLAKALNDAIRQTFGEKATQQTENQPTPQTKEGGENIRQRYLDDFNIVEDSSFDWRVTSGLSTADRKKAVADIKAGKETAATKKLEQEIKEAQERGTVIINRGRGNQAESVEIPINEWFGLDTKEQNKIFEDAEKLDEESVRIINESDITLQNIDDLKHLFNGFPYEQSDFQNVKDYLTRQGERSSQAAEISQGSKTAADQEIIGGEGIPPTTTPPVAEGKAESDIGGITQAANAVRRQEQGLPEYERSPETFEGWMAEAEKLLKEGYDVEKLMKRLQANGDATPVENAIRKIYYATIDAEIAKNPTDELLKLQKRAAEVGDAVNARAGKNLVSLKGQGSPLSSISDFYVAKMEAAGTDTLTDAQKKEVKEQYDAVKKTENDADAKLQALEAENARLKAEVELAKATKASSKRTVKEKRTHEDFVKERDTYRDELKKAREKHNEWLKEQGIQKQGVGGFVLTTDMAKVITKIVKSHVDENVTKLKDVIEKVLDDIKDIFPEITEKDIHNVIAGEYAEKKATRSELAARMRDLKDEAYYANKLERLLSGTEPKSEKDKQKRNQEITELRKKIAEFKTDEIAANKFYGESDAGNRKLEKLEDELDRIRERRTKEKPEKDSKEEKEISAAEQKLLDEIETAQAEWDAEHEAAAVAKKQYRALETERNRQIERVEGLRKKLKSLADEGLPERKKGEKKKDTPEIDALKEEIAQAEKVLRSAKATQEKIRKQEQELQRLRDRREKDPSEVNKKAVTDREKELKEQIVAERKEFEKEKREANKFYTDETPEEVKKLRTIKSRNEKQMSDIKERISKGEFETKKKIPFLENPELKKKFPKQYKDAMDAILAREEARHEFDIALMKDQMAKRSLAKKGIDVLGDVIGTTKSVVTGIDASGIGIQNLVAMVAHPRSAIEALPASFVDFGSAKNQERWLASVHNSELYPLAKKAGLDITEPQSLKSSEKEEIFTHNLLDRKIKFKGKTYIISKYTTKPFERIFTGLGNRMRWNLWARGVEKLIDEGITYEKHPEEYEALAKVLNTETGRGKLHPQVDKAFEFISAGIWSPRLMASRMNILGLGDLGNLIAGGKKGYYGGLTPRMRAYALKDFAKFVIFGAAFLGAAGLTFADDVDLDPNSATFGSMLVNGKRYNIWGGFTQYVRLVAKYVMGGEKQGGVFKESNPLVTTGRFLWSKTTPAVGVGISLAHENKQGVSTDYMGKPVTVGDAVKNLIMPLSIKGISQGIEKEGAGSLLWTGLPSFVGLNVSYESDFNKPSPASTKKETKPQRKNDRKPTKN